MSGVLHGPLQRDRVRALDPIPRMLAAGLAAIAAEHDDDVTRALVAELVERMIVASTPAEIFASVTDASLYVTARLRGDAT